MDSVFPFEQARLRGLSKLRKSLLFNRGVLQGSILGPVLFSLFINDLPTSLPTFISFSLNDDDLAIWSSSPSAPTAVKATQGDLIWMDRWCEHWCLPLNPRNCEASFYSTPLFYTPTFLGTPSTALFFFLLMYLRIRPSSFFVSRPCAVFLVPHGIPSKSPSLFRTKHFLATSTLLSWYHFSEQPVAPLPAAFCPPLFHFSSQRRNFLSYEPIWIISHCHLMSEPFVFNLLFHFWFGHT